MVAVAVVFAVGQVVLVVVADQIGQGETIMAGDEINGVAGAAAMVAVEIRAARYTGSQRGYLAGMAAHEGANIIPEAAIPFRPTLVGGKAAHLVEAARIPGLGDNFGIA